MPFFGSSTPPPNKPPRRLPKKFECDRFLSVYAELSLSYVPPPGSGPLPLNWSGTVPKSIAKAVNAKIDKLDLKKCGLADRDIVVLSRALVQLPLYGKVNLQKNSIGVEGVKALIETMHDHLSRMVLGRYSADEMAELREVNVDGNLPSLAGSKATQDLHSYQDMLLFVRMRLDMREAFFRTDVRQSGELEAADLQRVVASYTGEKFSEDKLKVMLAQFGNPRLGNITLIGFESAIVHMLQTTMSNGKSKGGPPAMPRMTAEQETLLHASAHGYGVDGKQSSAAAAEAAAAKAAETAAEAKELRGDGEGDDDDDDDDDNNGRDKNDAKTNGGGDGGHANGANANASLGGGGGGGGDKAGHMGKAGQHNHHGDDDGDYYYEQTDGANNNNKTLAGKAAGGGARDDNNDARGGNAAASAARAEDDDGRAGGRGPKQQQQHHQQQHQQQVSGERDGVLPRGGAGDEGTPHHHVGQHSEHYSKGEQQQQQQQQQQHRTDPDGGHATGGKGAPNAGGTKDGERSAAATAGGGGGGDDHRAAAAISGKSGSIKDLAGKEGKKQSYESGYSSGSGKDGKAGSDGARSDEDSGNNNASLGSKKSTPGGAGASASNYHLHHQHHHHNNNETATTPPTRTANGGVKNSPVPTPNTWTDESSGQFSSDDDWGPQSSDGVGMSVLSASGEPFVDDGEGFDNNFDDGWGSSAGNAATTGATAPSSSAASQSTANAFSGLLGGGGALAPPAVDTNGNAGKAKSGLNVDPFMSPSPKPLLNRSQSPKNGAVRNDASRVDDIFSSFKSTDGSAADVPALYATGRQAHKPLQTVKPPRREGDVEVTGSSQQQQQQQQHQQQQQQQQQQQRLAAPASSAIIGGDAAAKFGANKGTVPSNVSPADRRPPVAPINGTNPAASTFAPAHSTTASADSTAAGKQHAAAGAQSTTTSTAAQDFTANSSSQQDEAAKAVYENSTSSSATKQRRFNSSLGKSPHPSTRTPLPVAWKESENPHTMTTDMVTMSEIIDRRSLLMSSLNGGHRGHSKSDYGDDGANVNLTMQELKVMSIFELEGGGEKKSPLASLSESNSSPQQRSSDMSAHHVVQLSGSGHLSLSKLGLTSIVFPHTITIATLDSLVSLDLSYNQLMSLNTPALASLPSLLHLNVSHNLLQRLAPPGNNNLPETLETLDASFNNLTKVSGLDKCMDLRNVNLSNNKMKQVSGLEFLGNLVELDLSSNEITTPVAIRTLSCNLALRSLKMKGNPIAATRGYRPTITCLLPHVKSIDSTLLPRCKPLACSAVGKAEKEQRAKSPKKKIALTPAAALSASIDAKEQAEALKKARVIQAEKDRIRMEEWTKILKARAEIPAYVEEHAPKTPKLTQQQEDALIFKLAVPMREPKKKVESSHYGKTAFGRSLPVDETEVKPKADTSSSSGAGGATLSVAAIKARMASGQKGALAASGGGGGERERPKSGGKEKVDLSMLHQEVLRLQKLQETGLNVVTQQQHLLALVTGDLADTRSRLARQAGGLLSSPLRGLSAVDLLSDFRKKASSSNGSDDYGDNDRGLRYSSSLPATTTVFARKEIAEWVREMEQEHTTAESALHLLADMYRRQACSPQTLVEYKKTLQQIGIFDEVKIPSFSRDGYTLSDEETLHVGDVAKRVVNSRVCVRQMLNLLETEGDSRLVEDLVKKLEEGQFSGVEGLGKVEVTTRDDEAVSVASSRWSTEAVFERTGRGSSRLAGAAQQMPSSATTQSGRGMLSDTASMSSTIPEEREKDLNEMLADTEALNGTRSPSPVTSTATTTMEHLTSSGLRQEERGHTYGTRHGDNDDDDDDDENENDDVDLDVDDGQADEDRPLDSLQVSSGEADASLLFNVSGEDSYSYEEAGTAARENERASATAEKQPSPMQMSAATASSASPAQVVASPQALSIQERLRAKLEQQKAQLSPTSTESSPSPSPDLSVEISSPSETEEEESPKQDREGGRSRERETEKSMSPLSARSDPRQESPISPQQRALLARKEAQKKIRWIERWSDEYKQCWYFDKITKKSEWVAPNEPFIPYVDYMSETDESGSDGENDDESESDDDDVSVDDLSDDGGSDGGR